jgi:hypothetical protein
MSSQRCSASVKASHNHRMKLTGAAILVSRGMKVLQAAPAAYPYRSAAKGESYDCKGTIRGLGGPLAA